jgi:hypothetical protein
MTVNNYDMRIRKQQQMQQTDTHLKSPKQPFRHHLSGACLLVDASPPTSLSISSILIFALIMANTWDQCSTLIDLRSSIISCVDDWAHEAKAQEASNTTSIDVSVNTVPTATSVVCVKILVQKLSQLFSCKKPTKRMLSRIFMSWLGNMFPQCSFLWGRFFFTRPKACPQAISWGDSS